jgi:hypothetical protein
MLQRFIRNPNLMFFHVKLTYAQLSAVLYDILFSFVARHRQDVTDSKSSTEFDLVEPGSGPGFVSPSQFLRPAQAAAASIAMAQIRAEANAAKPVRKEKPLDQRAAEKAKQSDLKRKREKSTKSNKHKVSGGKGSDEVDSESEEVRLGFLGAVAWAWVH